MKITWVDPSQKNHDLKDRSIDRSNIREKFLNCKHLYKQTAKTPFRNPKAIKVKERKKRDQTNPITTSFETFKFFQTPIFLFKKCSTSLQVFPSKKVTISQSPHSCNQGPLHLKGPATKSIGENQIKQTLIVSFIQKNESFFFPVLFPFLFIHLTCELLLWVSS